MNEQTILKLSIVGFLIFFSISLFYFYHFTTNISELKEGKFYCVKGNYTKIKEFKSCILGKIKDKTGEINVFFCNNTKTYKLLQKTSKTENIIICGKTEIYNGILELKPE